MKNTILFILLGFGLSSTTAQTLSSGNYSSSDLGYSYTVVVKHEGNLITITEPNRSNQYKCNGGNTYYHTEQKYSQFYITVTANNKYYAGKQGGTKQLYTYSGSNTKEEEEVLPSGVNNCALYDKYLSLTQTDHVDAQIWAFCGAAALAKCTYTEVNTYLDPIVMAMKSTVEDSSKCPCEDVISAKEWSAIPNE